MALAPLAAPFIAPTLTTAAVAGAGIAAKNLIDRSRKKASQQTSPLRETTTPTGSTETAEQAESRIAQEQAAAGQKSSKQAAAFLKNRNASGFGANPNRAKPFLLSI